MPLTIAPLAEAVKRINAKTPIGSVLTSAQWEGMPHALRTRAQLSARVESARVMSTIQDKLAKRIGLLREEVAHGEAIVSRDSFIRDVRAIARAEGIETQDGNYTGTIRDIRSVARLGLIFDTQMQMAYEHAGWKMGQDPDVLNEFPAQRFLRVMTVEKPREGWPERWQAAGDSVNWEGALPAPMIALKTSGIWEALSRFGDPWPPFDYGSGMGLEDVDREEAEALGLVQPGEVVEPIEADFNANLEASVQGLSPSMLDELQRVFGDQIEVVDGAARWVGEG